MNGEIQINPKLLKWAREERGYSKPEIANKIHVAQEKYSAWEDTGTGLGLDDLITLSKICKRQIAFFFLPSVPPKTKKPTDFRNLEPKQARLTEKTLLAIRRTVRYQEFLLQLHGDGYYEEKYTWISEYKKLLQELPENIDDITDWVRGLLNYPTHEQLTDRISPEASYQRWRNSVEQNLGVYVFQFAMAQFEVQGFSYSDSFPYCIVINNAYAPTSRTFTLFHELSHIMKSQSGLCKPHDTFFKRGDSVEYDCNNFAGSLLVPSNEVIPAHDKDTIFEYAQRFKISSEVYLRRLFTLGYVSETEFFDLLDQIRKSVLPTIPHYIGSPVKKAINSRGTALFDSTVDAMNKREISYSLASDILGLKINYLFSL
ncbi:MAG: XRE family transcriptional regulator [Dehalococcoidia bacterium]|nr:XRE family transcriptional regulator [Dehalococcoidia bacterium]